MTTASTRSPLPLGQAGHDAPRQIRIAAREAVFTRLLREPGYQLDDWLQAEPAPLAYWGASPSRR